MYVVQLRLRADEDDDIGWVDWTVVSVPAKTKRKTVIAKAVEQNDPFGTAREVVLRVIPAEHAEPIKVEMEQPPPRLKIG